MASHIVFPAFTIGLASYLTVLEGLWLLARRDVFLELYNYWLKIFATGFAPFRGGPMHYARARGIADVRDTLNRLAQQYGPRFQPDPGWDTLK